MKSTDFALCWPWLPAKANEHGRYERIWLKSLHILSNLKGFPTLESLVRWQAWQWPAGRTWLVTQIHMPLIWIKSQWYPYLCMLCAHIHLQVSLSMHGNKKNLRLAQNLFSFFFFPAAFKQPSQTNLLEDRRCHWFSTEDRRCCAFLQNQNMPN